MIEKLAELIWAKLEPRIKKTVEEAYNKGADDTVRRFAFVYDAVAQTAKADVAAQYGEISIEDIDEAVCDEIDRELHPEVFEEVCHVHD